MKEICDTYGNGTSNYKFVRDMKVGERFINTVGDVREVVFKGTIDGVPVVRVKKVM